MAFISYAQNFEDVVLWRALSDVEAGCYLDVGAQDPFVDSVSRAFYEAGWRGIHVEPTPAYAQALRENRPDELVIEAVVSTELGLKTFCEISGTGLSTGVADIAGRHQEAGWDVVRRVVPSIPLESLLCQFQGKDIHWLKIDVEGMELDVLHSWGSHPARPWILVIESTFPTTQEPTHHAWIDEVLQRGYREVYFDGLSRYFLSETQMQRRHLFSAPPNVFDQFQVERHHFSSGLIRQSEEMMRQRLEEMELTASEQESRFQLDIAQRDESASQRERLHHEQINDLQEALQQRQHAYDRLQLVIGEKEDEIARLNRKLEQLRADGIGNDQAHRSQIEGLEAALAIARSTMDRLGLELDQRAEELRAAPSQERIFELLQVERDRYDLAHRSQIEGLEAALAIARSTMDRLGLELDHRTNDLHTARDEWAAAREKAAQEMASHRAISADREQQLTHDIDALEAQLAEAARAFAEIQQRHDEQKADLAAKTQVLGEALSLFVAVKSEGLWRKTRLGSTVIDKSAFLNFSGHVSAFLAQIGHRNIAAQQGFLDHGLKLVTAPHMLNDIPGSMSEPSRATTLAELLSHHDLAFVRCAYRTVLGREPDSAGEAYYLARLRGGIAKLHILRQLRRSDEAFRHDPGIAGLDRAARHYWYGRTPVIGALIRLFVGGEGDSAADRRFRILANELGIIRQVQLSVFHDLSGQIRDIRKNVRASSVSPEALPLVSPVAPPPSVTDVDDSDISPEGRRILRRIQALASASGEGHA